MHYNIEDYLLSEDKFKSEASLMSKHIKMKKNVWAFTSWNKGEVSLDRHNIINQNEKLLNEYASDIINNTNKAVHPKKFEGNDNVILLQGIKESIDRDIGAVSTTLNWSSIGSSSTAESESQTDLQTEFTDTAYSRLVFSTGGSRTRLNQTMKLGMLWDDTSFDSTPVTIREAGVHWHLSDASKCHARVVSTDFILNSGDLFVVQINELQENGTL